MFDKRRFQRIDVDFEVELFSSAKLPVGKGKAIDVSTSGMGVKCALQFKFSKTADIFVTFKLPDETAFDKIRAEVRGVEKFQDGFLVKLRFTEMKVIDAMKEYISKQPAKEGGS